jgi:hypothetical protein
MTDSPNPRTPKRVGGNPAYVAAHGIANEIDLPFEHAYGLARDGYDAVTTACFTWNGSDLLPMKWVLPSARPHCATR